MHRPGLGTTGHASEGMPRNVCTTDVETLMNDEVCGKPYFVLLAAFNRHERQSIRGAEKLTKSQIFTTAALQLLKLASNGALDVPTASRSRLVGIDSMCDGMNASKSNSTCMWLRSKHQAPCVAVMVTDDD